MSKCLEFKPSETEVDECLVAVEVCDNVLECPCCCYFLHRRNRMDIEDFIDKHKLLMVLPDIAEVIIKSIQEDVDKAKLNKFRTKKELNSVLKTIKIYKI
jgi:hypothetical protein